MDELLPYYERELAFLRRSGREFAERFPKIAARLQMSGETCEDPHVERMIESFALLTARIGKKLEDEYPQLTEAIFAVLYPHYLRPFPACSIAQFYTESSASQLSGLAMVPRGTELNTRPIKGIPCRFRTTYDVAIAPLRISRASYVPTLMAPLNVVLPSNATGSISIHLESLNEQTGLFVQGMPRLRVFLDGDPSFVGAIRDALFMGVVAAYAQVSEQSVWKRMKATPLIQVGLEENEALIEVPPQSHPAYRLLAEYFAFPEKFGFFDLDLDAIRQCVGGSAKSVIIHLVLAGLRADSNQARILDGLAATRFKLGCTPVVNLFKQRADPIRLTHAAHSYPVVADSRRAYAFDVYSIDSVKLVKQNMQGKTVVDFRPFFSLRHGEDPLGNGHYWFTHRDEVVAKSSPGYETEISIVDRNFNPVIPETETLSIELTCTNRDLPSIIAYGLAGGDLFVEGGSIAKEIRLLRKPTTTCRFEHGRGAQWRLISHLTLNQLSLTQGVSVFKELLSLYDLPRSPISGRQIEGVRDLQCTSATAWLPGKPFASFVRGTEIRLFIDDASFVGSGIDAFVRVVERFFCLYVHINSFVRLVVVSSQSQEELVRCIPRCGESILV